MTPKKTPGQLRYIAWMDTFPEHQMTFGDWLKAGPAEQDTTCPSCIGTGIGDPRSESSCWSCGGSGERRQENDYEA